MALTATVAWQSIWSAKDTSIAPLPSINIWIRKWACIPSSALKNQVQIPESRIKYLRTSSNKILMRTSRIKSGIRISHLFLKNGQVRYNCTIIDLRDRSVIASITDRYITSDLAIRTLERNWIPSIWQRVAWSCTATREASIHQRILLSFENLSMWPRTWTMPDVHMTTHQWRSILIP